MIKYIKVNAGNEVIDVFFARQKYKFDGSEIEIDDRAPGLKLHNSSSIDDDFHWISDAYGQPTFEYVAGFGGCYKLDDTVILARFLVKYKQQRLQELKTYIRENWMDGTRTPDQIKTQLANAKSQASSWTTVAEVDNAYNTFITWIDG